MHTSNIIPQGRPLCKKKSPDLKLRSEPAYSFNIPGDRRDILPAVQIRTAVLDEHLPKDPPCLPVHALFLTPENNNNSRYILVS